MFKLKSDVRSNMKLMVEWMSGVEDNAGMGASNLSGDRGIYFIHGQSPMTVNQNMLGLSFDHVINNKTYYHFRFSRVHVKNDMWGAELIRDETPIRQIGAVWVDEQPWGWVPVAGYQYALADKMVLGGVGGGGRDRTKITTYNFKFDLSSQINKFNEIKAGFELTADNYDVFYGEEGLDPTGNFLNEWEQTPIRFGGYLQDKIEFEGMIANIGLRIDYNYPNVDWFTVDPYNPYFSRVFKDQLVEEAPTEGAKGHITISPRLGISHPISVSSKLFFNYGHFYSMPPSGDMYEINYGVASQGIERIGNPSLKMPRTIAYELGYEHELWDMFLLRLTGYYKDITDQIEDVRYVSYDESIDYSIAENAHYEDIRGFEIEVRKIWGRWITGWLNYTYMVNTEGQIGREFQFQDPRRQILEGKRDPQQFRPLPQPYARGNITLTTPAEWGPKLGKFPILGNWSFSLLGYYSAGDYLTWEPLPPYKLEDNLQWKDEWMFDARIQKRFNIGTFSFTLFADIVNLFDMKYLSGWGFFDEADYRDYMNSLHLPMYGEEKYQSDPRYVAGDDKVGDVWSEDKPYINMPNLDYMAWSVPRSITLGLRINF
jgi:outer membrane receptor protein involved in Fe transport